MESQQAQKSIEKTAGAIFVGFMFIGMGIDMVFDQSGFGMFIGMGLGFIVAAMYRSEKNK